MYDVIAQSAANAESLSEAPVYVLLRDSAVSEWTAKRVQDIWWNKIGPQARRFNYRCNSSLSVDHFKALAFSFRMTYAGPATETGGADVSKFYRLDDEVLPFFPDDVPARKRKTHWRWCNSNNVVDVLISTLDGLMLLLFETHGLSDPSDPAEYPKAFRKASADCVASFAVRCSAGSLRYVVDRVHDKVLEILGTAVPEGFDQSARPVSIQDYRTLAKKTGYTYLGVTDLAGESVHSEHILPRYSPRLHVFHCLRRSLILQGIFDLQCHCSADSLRCKR